MYRKTGLSGRTCLPVVDRRTFVGDLSRTSLALALSSASGSATNLLAGGPPPGKEDPLQTLLETAPEARFWVGAGRADSDCLACHSPEEKLEDSFVHKERPVKCRLCARECLLSAGERGHCRARINIEGKLRTLVYGRPISIHIDPIEKKPFFHFLPGSEAFSLATAGCPLRCRFCQNWELSQAKPEDHLSRYIPPEAIADTARSRRVPIIAFTYNEPTVFTEYLLDIAKFAKKRNIASVLVSCGFMTEEPLSEMCRLLDAIKIDLKGYSPEFYRNVCDAELAPVLRSIRQISKSGVHLEIVNLVVPTLNDSTEMLKELVKWVVGELGPDVPIHFTRFHPDYRLLNLPPTPVAALEKAYELARAEGLRYPFVGNVPGHPGNNTYCPNCQEIAIARSGFFVIENHLENGCCSNCGERLAGVWNQKDLS